MSTVLLEMPEDLAQGSNSIAAAAGDLPRRLDEKGLRLDWVRREFAHGLAEIARGRIPLAPLQIEVHPYSGSQSIPCNNRCIWCTRLGDKTELRAQGVVGIDPEKLIAFIASLEGSGVRRLVLSGNSTEPLLYPRIDEVIRAIHAAGMNWVLYTNFYYGAGIIAAALDCARRGDVLRVSLDAGNQESYLRTHRPQNDPQAFRAVTANLVRLLEERARRQSSLTVGVAYLLAEQNSTEEELRTVIEWGTQIGVDFMRFSVPLKPTHQNPEFDLTEAEADHIRIRITRLAAEHQRGAGSGTAHTKLYVRQDDVVQGPKPFSCCHHGHVIPVIGARGKVYPCTSTSIADFAHLGLGDVNAPDFPSRFWEIWRDAGKWRHDVRNCPDCTRFEYDLNVEIDGRLLVRDQVPVSTGYPFHCFPSHIGGDS